MRNAVFFTIINKAGNPVPGRKYISRGNLRIDVKQLRTASFPEKFRGHLSAKIVVCRNTVDRPVLPFNRHDRNAGAGQLLRRKGIAQDDHPFNFVGHQLLEISALHFFVVVPVKHQEFESKLPIGSQNFIQDLIIKMMVQVGKQDSDHLCLPVCKHSGDLVLPVIQLLQSFRDCVLFFQRERISVIKIPRYGCFGKACVLCYILISNCLLSPHIELSCFQTPYLQTSYFQTSCIQENPARFEFYSFDSLSCIYSL